MIFANGGASFNTPLTAALTVGAQSTYSRSLNRPVTTRRQEINFAFDLIDGNNFGRPGHFRRGRGLTTALSAACAIYDNRP